VWEEVWIAKGVGDLGGRAMSRRAPPLVPEAFPGNSSNPNELAALLPRPEAVQELPVEVIPGLLCQLSALQAALAARLLAAKPVKSLEDDGADQLLDVKAAADRLGTTPDWLYRNAKSLPFTIRLGLGQLRFSARGIGDWIRNRRGR